MKSATKRRFFIKSLILGTGGLMIRNYNVSAAHIDKDSILLKMIYNNIGSNPNFKKSWGLGIWIIKNNDAVLLDTGDNPDILWTNIQAAGIDLNILSKIIISHNHNDHTDGLPVVLEKTNFSPVVYVPEDDADDILKRFGKINLKAVSGPLKITDSIWSTGQLKAINSDPVFYEQSLIIIKNNIQYILTGCAHSGVVEIAERAREMHPDKEIALVAGGFHLSRHTPGQVKEISDRLNQLSIKKIAPSHCTGARAISYFRTEWKDRFMNFNLGDELTV